MVKRFHISSCGRSGTKYVAEAIRCMGVSVIHEMGDDWPIPSDAGVAYFAKHKKKFRNYRGVIGWKWSLLTPGFAAAFPVQMHMVRHPVPAITSATTHSPRLFETIEARLGPTDFIQDGWSEEKIWVARAINYWIRYNTEFSANKTVLKVEEFTASGAATQKFCELTGAEPSASDLIDNIPKNVNARPKASRRVEISWALLDAEFPEQAARLRELARGYGYDD